jgi:hypothetical protein
MRKLVLALAVVALALPATAMATSSPGQPMAQVSSRCHWKWRHHHWVKKCKKREASVPAPTTPTPTPTPAPVSKPTVWQMSYEEGLHAIEGAVARYTEQWPDRRAAPWHYQIFTPCKTYPVHGSMGVLCGFRIWVNAEAWCAINFSELATGPYLVDLFEIAAFPDNPTVNKVIDIGEPVPLHESTCVN